MALQRNFRFRFAEDFKNLLTRRMVSSKQVAEEPGKGCCRGPKTICPISEEVKPKGKKEEEQCPKPPMKYDEEFKDQLQHKERKYQKTWHECPPRQIATFFCKACEPGSKGEL